MVSKGGVVKVLNAKGFACVTQGQMETMTDYAKSFGAKGLAYIKVENGEWKSPIVKFSVMPRRLPAGKMGIEEGDLILFAAEWLNACEILGKIRLYCAEKLSEMGKMTIPTDQFTFLWVVDFPLLMFDKEMNRYSVITRSPHLSQRMSRNSPAIPRPSRPALRLVVNGVELGGGSIRIHNRDVQTILEEVLQIPPDVAQEIRLHARGVPLRCPAAWRYALASTGSSPCCNSRASAK